MTTPLLRRSLRSALAGRACLASLASLLLLAVAALPLRAQTTITYIDGETNTTPINTTGNYHFLTIDSGSATQSGVISGTGDIYKFGAGTLTLSAANTYTGVTYLQSGTLVMGHASALASTSYIQLIGPVILDFGSFGYDRAALVFDHANGALPGLEGTITSSGAFTFNVSGGFTQYLNITGSASVNKTGTGLLTLAGNNTYTGGTTLAGGTLRLDSANAIGSTGTISFTGGALEFTASNTTDYSARFSTAPGQLYRFGNSSGLSVTLASDLTSVGGSLTVDFGANLTLTGTNTYSGGTILNGGTIQFSSAANLGTGPLTISDYGGTLIWAPGNTTDLGSRLNGASGSPTYLTLDTNGNNVTLSTQFASTDPGSNIAKIGAGSLTLTGASPFNGSFRLSEGDLILGHTDALKFAQIHLNFGDPSQLSFTSITAATIGGLRQGGASVLLQNTAAAPVALTLSSSSDFSGTISGSGSLGLGGGEHILSGASTFTGGTTVQSGATLFAENSTGSATGSGPVAVLSGGRLGGTGFIGGLTTFNSGAHLSPGNSVGTLTFTGGLTLSGGSILDFQLGTTSDLLRVTGGTFSGPSSGSATINFSDSGGFGLGTYTLINYATATGTSNLGPSAFSLGTTVAGYSYSLSHSGGALQLNVSAIPEPSTYAAIFGACALGLAIYRRRQK